MMKRLYLIYILCLCCWLGGRAQELRSLFVAMPDSVLPLLTKTNRMDCIDFLDSNMKAEVISMMKAALETFFVNRSQMHNLVIVIDKQCEN